MGYKITIDGPAGTGKGTLAKSLAKNLNIANVDSGSLYRTFGLYAMRIGLEPTNIEKLEEALANVEIELKEVEGKLLPHLNNENVEGYIRNEEVARTTSKFASIKQVREYIAVRQRRLAEGRNVIMEGRDIGSSVFPDAELKIFLNADVHERANRRYKQLLEKGENITFEKALDMITTRDHADMTREVSPLVKTEDMIEIDTTDMSIEQVVERAMELVKMKGLI